jgi:hypothetical protein
VGKHQDKSKELEVQKLHARFNVSTNILIKETDVLIAKLRKSKI